MRLTVEPCFLSSSLPSYIAPLRSSSSSWLLLLFLVASPLATALANAADLLPPQIPLSPPPSEPHEFHLQHIFHHGTHRHPSLHRRLDVLPAHIQAVTADDGLSTQAAPPPLHAAHRPLPIQRPLDRSVPVVEARLLTARTHGLPPSLPADRWTIDAVDAPDITDKPTVLALAKMAANAYIMEPGTERWEDVGAPYNHSRAFGWQSDGLRGHVYATRDNTTVVIALKGTSTALFDGQGTTTNDKLNDNLFFSCCCAQRGSFLWRQVCDCAADAYACNATCLAQHLRAENRYYRAALDLYANVSALYPPPATVWLAGHSLGGAVASLLGQTYGLPVVTFEAVPEALPASRLGLPRPPGGAGEELSGVFHFGHTADPLYMGTCNGLASVCTLAGYALESACHTGRRCVYDTVEDLGWRSGIGTHRILTVIAEVIEKYDDVPPCVADTECVDCFNWRFFESHHSDPGETSTSTTQTQTETETETATRTSTCKTPGWWGCLDPTTTSDGATTGEPTEGETETSSSTTCHTPGWFGCRDPVTTTASTTPDAPATTTPTDPPTETCRDPGWFGCRDPTSAVTATPTASGPATVTATTTTTPAPTATTQPAATTSTPCLTPGRFFGCWDEPGGGPEPTSSGEGCARPGWFWGCRD